jgi:galactokinase
VNQLLASLREDLPDARALAFAPGRVNLIGEHTDYNGLPVLPFAIGLGVAAAAAPRSGQAVLVRSVLPDRFAAESIPLAELAARPRAGTWVDYVVAGLRLHPPAAPCEILVRGDLPAAAGLSSSSALVVASALLFAPADVDRAQLAQRTAEAERYVGTQSGGMDQAASLLGQQGHALRIAFRPLRVQPVPVPAELAVVIADSGVRAEKGGAAQRAYNERVEQCSRAAAAFGVPKGGLLADLPGKNREARARSLRDPLLARRAGFVYAEAARVDEAMAAMQANDLTRLGRLIDASHAGLRDEYEVSHPTVDALVEAAKRNGALGARIVGAGFGGCCIALTTTDRAKALVTALLQAGAADAFPVRPGAGASIASI